MTAPARGAAGYRHTQRGTRVALFVVLAVAVPLVVAGVSVRAAAARDAGAPAVGVWPAVALGALVAAAAAATFSRMTIEVTRDELRWSFVGPLGRGRIARADIASVAPTETTLLADGVGVHRAVRGWVYNVSLGSAVLVTRRDGSAVVLGTDDRDGLLAALTHR